MSGADDTWPQPNYDPGSPKHLHALGVISITFAAFERSIDSHYVGKLHKLGLPDDMGDFYYGHLNLDRRLEALDFMFSRPQEENEVSQLMTNLTGYFRWCRNCRNQLLHSERYPAAFGGHPDFLYLTKPLSKGSTRSGHMKVSVERLRFIADKIRDGVRQSAYMHLHLRHRGLSPEKVSADYREYVEAPDALEIPKPLELSPWE